MSQHVLFGEVAVWYAVNFGRVLEAAVAGRRLVRAMAYVIRSDTPEEQRFEALEKQGFELKVKDCKFLQVALKRRLGCRHCHGCNQNGGATRRGGARHGRW